jgi:hypothetical protein
VESGIFYAAIFDGRDDVKFQPARVLERPNLLLFPHSEQLSDVIHIAKTDGMELFSDIVSQRLICL